MSPPERPPWLPLPGAFPMSPDRRWYWDGARWQPNLLPPPSVALARGVMVAVAVATASVTAPVAYLVFVFGAFESSTLAIGGIAVFAVAELAFLVAGLSGVICLPAWTHSCHRYLLALGAQGLRWSPAWAAWGWFVPLLNLAIPPLVICEIWQHSRRRQERWPPLIWAWWVTWLAGDVALVTTLLIYRSWVVVSIPLWLSSQVVSCVLLVRLVGLISRRLEERYAGLLAAVGVRPPGQPPGPTG